MQESRSVRWKWGVFAAIAMTLMALYPQINLWLVRGREWNGGYVTVHGDESAYSAYIQALIDGRPRRNNPYSGRDDVPGKPQPESLFSIQFIPAYAIALPARALGATAATAFIALLVIIAFGATLALFWLLVALTGDERLSAAGALFTLCFGTLAAGQGEIFNLLHISFTGDSFLFLRRYQPAAAFPLFFLLCAFVWHMLTAETSRKALLWSALSGLQFVILVFSYFYLWTAAAAWLACAAVIWLGGRPSEWKRTVSCFAVVGAFGTVALVPYSWLLSRRDASTDVVQLLDISHRPDLLRIPEIMGLIIMLALVLGVARRLFARSDPRFLFLVSFALMPLVTFNQQVITGRSLQPFHYEWFVTNYLLLAALVATAFFLWQARGAKGQRVPGRVAALLALVALGLGIVEMAGATSRTASYARVCDEALAVGHWLAEAGKTDGTYSDSVRDGRVPRPVVFSSSLAAAGILPTVAPQAMLFVWHVNSFPTSSMTEGRELFFKYLYYSGATEEELSQSFLSARTEILSAFFGIERVLPDMALHSKPIALSEARSEVMNYAAYMKSFTREEAAVPALSYVVVPTDASPSLENIDRWYERDAGERVGIFTVYRVKLRPTPRE